MNNWKELAIELAKQGQSWRSIAKLLGVPKSTVSDWLRNQPLVKVEQQIKKPRILFLDIETAPTRAYIWQRWKQNISQSMVISEGFILSVAWKWLGEDETHFKRIYSAVSEDDYHVVDICWNLLQEADIVVAHNAKKFDIKVLNTRFVLHGFVPPSSYKVVDTLLIARKNFRFPSNALDSLGAYLGLGRKVKHEGFDLWSLCMQDDEAAWSRMEEYNIQDITLLEEVYLTLRPWDTSHPNVGLYVDHTEFSCPVCGSMEMSTTGNSVYTNVSEFEEWKCNDCGHISRGRKNKLNPEKNVLVNAR